VNTVTFRWQWLALLLAMGTGIVLFNSVFPGAGIAMALGFALWFGIQNGVFDDFAGWAKHMTTQLARKQGDV
jgi:hypothetical protein